VDGYEEDWRVLWWVRASARAGRRHRHRSDLGVARRARAGARGPLVSRGSRLRQGSAGRLITPRHITAKVSYTVTLAPP
jgi:hypothetical protein